MKNLLSPHQGMERKGVEGRSEFGVLLFEKDEATTEDFNLGSRLKTPVLPIWITRRFVFVHDKNETKV